MFQKFKYLSMTLVSLVLSCKNFQRAEEQAAVSNVNSSRSFTMYLDNFMNLKIQPTNGYTSADRQARSIEITSLSLTDQLPAFAQPIGFDRQNILILPVNSAPYRFRIEFQEGARSTSSRGGMYSDSSYGNGTLCTADYVELNQPFTAICDQEFGDSSNFSRDFSDSSMRSESDRCKVFGLRESTSGIGYCRCGSRDVEISEINSWDRSEISTRCNGTDY